LDRVRKPTKARLAPPIGDADLAWQLATAAHAHLSRPEADRIYVALGVGEA
jgi:hypothetical protein